MQRVAPPKVTLSAIWKMKIMKIMKYENKSKPKKLSQLWAKWKFRKYLRVCQFLTDLQSLANFQFFQKTKKCNFSVDPFNSQQDNSVFKTYEVIKTRKRHIWKTNSVEKQRIRSLLTLDLKQLNSKGIHAQKKHFKAQCNQIRNWLRPSPHPFRLPHIRLFKENIHKIFLGCLLLPVQCRMQLLLCGGNDCIIGGLSRQRL